MIIVGPANLLYVHATMIFFYDNMATSFVLWEVQFVSFHTILCHCQRSVLQSLKFNTAKRVLNYPMNISKSKFYCIMEQGDMFQLHAIGVGSVVTVPVHSE